MVSVVGSMGGVVGVEEDSEYDHFGWDSEVEMGGVNENGD